MSSSHLHSEATDNLEDTVEIPPLAHVLLLVKRRYVAGLGECGERCLCPTYVRQDIKHTHELWKTRVAIKVSASNALAPATLRGRQPDPRDNSDLDYIKDFEEPPHLSNHHHIAIPTRLR